MSFGYLSQRGLASKTLLSTIISPEYLFRNNEQGAWYDPSDLTTLFQDQAGTTPVTAVEQPVSLVLDKSKGGGSIGADTVVNGTFATDSDWTKGTGWSIGSGVATKIVGTAALLSQSAVLTVGRSYIITYTITRITGTLTAQLTGGTAVSGTARSAAGTYTDILTAVSGNNAIAFSADALFVGTVDSVTLRLLPAGNHAYTPSTATASRPVLSARVNLLTKTEQFNDAAWSKFNTVVVAPSLSGISITFPAIANAAHFSFITQTAGSVVSGTGIVYTAEFKATTSSDIGKELYLRLAVDGIAVMQLVTLTNDWQKITISYTTLGSTTLGAAIGVFGANFGGKNTAAVVADVRNADLRVANDGVGIPSYQRVNTSTDYDTVGFPLYLRCDGTDDYMLTNSIDFSGTDKMTVWAGVRKLSDAATGIFTELSADATNGTNSGSFALLSPSSTGANSYRFTSYGNTNLSPAGTGIFAAAPNTSVLAGIGDISGDISTLRRNGSLVETSTTDQGAGNFGNYPLYLFRRNAATLPFNGRCYGIIVRGEQTVTSDVAKVENWVNTKTLAY